MARQTYLIALGSNRRGKTGSPREIIAALVALAEAGAAAGDRPFLPQAASACAGAMIVGSTIHTTRPFGPGRRNYANAVALIESDRAPPAFLEHLKAVERVYGRRPGRRWGDRPLDLDIIAWSGGRWSSHSLTIPHPAFRARRFVLAPLVEIAPRWRDPVTRFTARQLLARLDRPRPRA